MKSNYTRIAIVLDRSGSMATCREATVAGFNEFIRKQKELSGDVKVSLIQFDDVIDQVWTKMLQDVTDLTQETFVPRGSTALLDAQGTTIVKLGEELAAQAPADRPENVIVLTLTDGQENASKEYTADMIAVMVKTQREAYNWQFIFLGANQDAIKTAARMNIGRDSSLTYSTDRKSLMNTMRSASNYVGAVRSRGIGANPSTSRSLLKTVSLRTPTCLSAKTLT